MIAIKYVIVKAGETRGSRTALFTPPTVGLQPILGSDLFVFIHFHVISIFYSSFHLFIFVLILFVSFFSIYIVFIVSFINLCPSLVCIFISLVCRSFLDPLHINHTVIITTDSWFSPVFYKHISFFLHFKCIVLFWRRFLYNIICFSLKCWFTTFQVIGLLHTWKQKMF